MCRQERGNGTGARDEWYGRPISETRAKKTAGDNLGTRGDDAKNVVPEEGVEPS